MTCPHCRTKGFQNILDKAMIREIKEFKVRCTNKKRDVSGWENWGV